MCIQQAKKSKLLSKLQYFLGMCFDMHFGVHLENSIIRKARHGHGFHLVVTVDQISPFAHIFPLSLRVA